MEPSDSLRTAGRLLVGAPTRILPAFIAASGAALVPQVFVMLGVFAAYLSLRGTGRIARVWEAAAALLRWTRGETAGGATPTGTGGFGPTAPGMGAAFERLGDAVAGLFTPQVIAILALTAAVAAVVGLVARAAAAAGRVHTTVGALRGRRPTAAGVAGARRDWLSLAGFLVVRLLAIGGPTVVYLVVVAAATGVSPVLGVLALVFGGLVWVLVVVVAYLLLLFVPQGIAVEGEGLAGGLRHSWGFLRSNFLRVLLYVGVQIGVGVALAVAGFVLSLLNVDRLLSVVVTLGVGPWLALFKTGLYLDADPPAGRPAPAGERFRAAATRAGRELRAFPVGHPGAIAGCAAVFAAGTLGGYLAAAPYSLGLDAPSDATEVFGVVPVDQFITIAANNWLVAATQTFAGLALGVPALSNLLFNGLIVGVVVGLTFDLPVAVAFIAPHGLVEVPALVVSGAVGVHLGRHVWRYLRGPDDAAALAAELRRALFVLLALAPAFVVAAAIEAFVTPWVVTLLA